MLIIIRNKHSNTHTHTRLTALFLGLPGWAGTRKVKPIWILMKQETVSGSGNSLAICKSAPRSRQITMPAPHRSVFLQTRCPSCRPTNSIKALKAINKHSKWHQILRMQVMSYVLNAYCANAIINVKLAYRSFILNTHTHTRLTALCPGLPRWAGTRKVQPIWILLKQETVSGIGISWAICKSAPCSRQITMPAPHRSVFLQAGCPSCRPTNSVRALKAFISII